jgi:hypothetical protein
LPTSLYCYAWDLTGEAGRANLARIVELGLGGISLATSYHAGKFLRPAASDAKVVFPEDGTVYFRPRAHYGRVKPLVSQVTEVQDVLVELTRRRDLAIQGWTVLLHNSRLGLAHPDLVVRNAWGDPLYYSLCPAQPEVQAYAVTLCADLCSHYDIAGLALETPGFLPFVHGYHHEFAQIPGNPWMNLLLGLCFCDACRDQARRAGIAVEALQRRVREAVHHYQASAATVPDDMAAHWLAADLAFDPELGELLRWRCRLVAGLVAAIRGAIDRRFALSVIPSVQRPSAAGWSEGSDLALLAAAADTLSICFYEPDPARVLADLIDCRRRAGPAANLGAILRPGHPDMTSEQQLLASIAALAGHGIRDFSFYNFGMLRPHNLAWLEVATAAIGRLH